jgi:hypothetical protein
MKREIFFRRTGAQADHCTSRDVPECLRSK